MDPSIFAAMRKLARGHRFSYSWPLRHQKGFVHMSAIYRPVNVTPPSANKQPSAQQAKHGEQDSLSKSFKLLVDNGLIRPSSCFGSFHLLPIALKAVEKLVQLIDHHLRSANCQQMLMPTLTSSSLWKKSGRLEECRSELMRLTDRNSKEFLLSPTHEEAICDLLGNQPLNQRQLPQKLYQVSDKFRDEARPRFGLLRGRQFLMKDLYTFDATLDAAKSTYNDISQVYRNILNDLDLKWVQAQGSSGSFGGLVSHEFHIISEIGEDSILHCASCEQSFNQELLAAQNQGKEDALGKLRAASGSVDVNYTNSCPSNLSCISCGSSQLSNSKCIEVAHTFLLGTKYTEALGAVYFNEKKEKLPLQMGCYGIGISRLLAAAVEVMSFNEEIRWPLRIAPYLVTVIPPKQGSREEKLGSSLSLRMYEKLRKILPNDVIYDDRTNQTIGKRLQDHRKLGIPYIIVCGKASQQGAPLAEIHDIKSSSPRFEDPENIVKYLYDVKCSLKLNP